MDASNGATWDFEHNRFVDYVEQLDRDLIPYTIQQQQQRAPAVDGWHSHFNASITLSRRSSSFS